MIAGHFFDTFVETGKWVGDLLVIFLCFGQE